MVFSGIDNVHSATVRIVLSRESYSGEAVDVELDVALMGWVKTTTEGKDILLLVNRHPTAPLIGKLGVFSGNGFLESRIELTLSEDSEDLDLLTCARDLACHVSTLRSAEAVFIFFPDGGVEGAKCKQVKKAPAG